VDFEGGEIPPDTGLSLNRQAGDRLRLIEGLAGWIEDRRDSRYAEHSMAELLRQRIYQVVRDVRIVTTPPG
jgi:hypothetical protein